MLTRSLSISAILLTGTFAQQQPAHAQTTMPAAPEVAFESFRYTGVDPYAAKVGADEFLNPILAGFYPDPSICRVGDDFYMVNSTFSYYPGVPIWHSRDLVSWRQVGNALTLPSQTESLRHTSTGGGVYAPTIEHHAGKFYVTSTLIGGRGGNFVITADRPEGPWSDPIWFRNIEGIDPALFFDDDGRTYLVHNGDAPEKKPLYDGHRALYVWEIDLKQGKTVSGPHLLVNGGVDLAKKPIWIEGPHLYKKDGWYYLCTAEGGTGPQHSQVILRSRSVMGPFEPFPGNPILTQRELPGDRPDPVTCTGHADLVELPNGDWWAVFLACRPIDGRHTVLTGRETFLLPVTWKDGWPMILEPGQPVPRVHKRPPLPKAAPPLRPTTGSFTVEDSFDGETLDMSWMSFRRPADDFWRLDDGKLKLRPYAIGLNSPGENPAFLARRQQHHDYTAETTVVVPPGTTAVDAGLAVFQDERHSYFLGIRSADGAAKEIFVERVTQPDRRNRNEVKPEIVKSATLSGAKQVELKVEGKGAALSFLYRLPGTSSEWTTLLADADATMLSERVAGGFTGVVIGVHARAVP